MYRPKYSENNDANRCLELIAENPLGTMISVQNSKVEISQLPFIIKIESEKVFLQSHLAKANLHSQLAGDASVHILFYGPDRYISPSWYQNKIEVPTWNYVSVQVSGQANILPEKTSQILSDSVEFFEKRNGTSWKYELPEEFRQKLMKAIVGIEIQITELTGKFKLSQNRTAVDYESVKNHLQQTALDNDKAMTRWMMSTTL